MGLSAAGFLSAGPLGISGGQGWVQFGELGMAFALSALIGLERELRQKAAGLRTHTLVGVSSALIMLVSKYGFSDVLVPGHIILDPSRVAAQIVSGVGGRPALADERGRPRRRAVSVLLVLHGRGPLADLAARLQEVHGVLAVQADTDAFG